MAADSELALIMNRIFDRLDTFEEKIDDICTRLVRLEESVKDHYNDIKEEEDRKAANENKKERKYYVLIAAMGIAFGLFEIAQNM